MRHLPRVLGPDARAKKPPPRRACPKCSQARLRVRRHSGCEQRCVCVCGRVTRRGGRARMSGQILAVAPGMALAVAREASHATADVTARRRRRRAARAAGPAPRGRGAISFESFDVFEALACATRLAVWPAAARTRDCRVGARSREQVSSPLVRCGVYGCFSALCEGVILNKFPHDIG